MEGVVAKVEAAAIQVLNGSAGCEAGFAPP